MCVAVRTGMKKADSSGTFLVFLFSYAVPSCRFTTESVFIATKKPPRSTPDARGGFHSLRSDDGLAAGARLRSV